MGESKEKYIRGNLLRVCQRFEIDYTLFNLRYEKYQGYQLYYEYKIITPSHRFLKAIEMMRFVDGMYRGCVILKKKGRDK